MLWHEVGGPVGLQIVTYPPTPACGLGSGMSCGFPHVLGPSAASLLSLRASPLIAGPSRALFLPGGLLAPNDVPAYLNGSLAGE